MTGIKMHRAAMQIMSEYQSVASQKHNDYEMQSTSNKERGVALIISLLILSLMTAVGLAMVLATNSDMLVNGYYRNYRGAYYAADSGLATARQATVNQIVSSVPTTFTRPPLSTTSVSSLNSSLYSSYGSSTTVQSSSSWGQSYVITNAASILSVPTCTVTASATIPPGTCTGDLLATAYKYDYPYSITSQGRSTNAQLTQVAETGLVTINVSQANATATQSFAAWGMFIDQQAVCSGSYLVPGLITGPVFTNGGWTFGTTGSYTFTDPVGAHSSTAGFQFGSCSTSTSGTATSGGQSITPSYQAGFTWGANTVPLPTNNYQQQRAVLDGLGTNLTAPTLTDKHNALNDANGTAYPSGSAPSSGVFMSYNSSTNTMTGGGIYIEGDAKVEPYIPTGGGTTIQAFKVTQGSGSGTVSIITINRSTNQTTLQTGSTTRTITGIPRDYTNASTPPATMVYVNGNITSLRGLNGQGTPAVQDGFGTNITAQSNITITGDVLYKTEPVTMTQNQIPGTPADTLIPGNNSGQTLGIFTATGTVYLNNAQSNGNLQIDASIATISAGGSGGITNNGAAINTLNIVGGRIQNSIMNINTTTRNVFFDRRFAPGNNFGPPWFPSTTVTSTAGISVITVPSIRPISWVTSPQ